MSAVAMYYFQSDPGESQEYPNAFVIPNTSKPTFGTFLQHFPKHEQQQQQLHFRFRVEDSTHDYVWLDITSKTEVLPFYRDSIMAKVLRVNELSTLKRKNLLRRKNMENIANSFVRSSAPPPPPQQLNRAGSSGTVPSGKNPYEPPRTAAEPSSVKSANGVSRPSAAGQQQAPQSPAPASTKGAATSADTKAAAKPAVPSLVEEEDMVGLGGVHSEATTATAGAGGANTHSSSSVPTTSAEPALAAAAVAAPPAPKIEESTLDRAELKAAKDSKINDQVRKAVEEKQEQDRKAAQEQSDFEIAKAKHEAKIQAWSTNNKEKRNIRSLLSTMHTVLWEGTRWKQIGLGDLLEPRQVKLQYRKAMLIVHTDHNVNATNEQKFISKRVFEAVNEAYNEFLKKESVS